MATRRGVSIAIVFGVFFVGLISVAFVPALFTAQNQPAETFDSFNEGDMVTVTDGLTVELIDAVGGGDAEVEVFDRPGSTRQTEVIAQNGSVTYNLPTGNITIEAVYVDSGTAELRISYPRDFGFTDAQEILASNIPLFAVILTIFMFLAFIVGVYMHD